LSVTLYHFTKHATIEDKFVIYNVFEAYKDGPHGITLVSGPRGLWEEIWTTNCISYRKSSSESNQSICRMFDTCWQ